MTLLDLLIKVSTKDDASNKVKSIADSVKGTMAGAAKAAGTAMLAVAGAAAAGTVALGKSALDAYANYEQMAGGVEKIFDQADVAQIFRDADNAYVDLNMSANQYLEAINRTGATFAQTMGDQKGYDTARKGMKAIADYASGTGRSVDELNEKYAMITRATSSYQSIADQFAGILPATSKDFLEQAQAAGFLSGEYTKLTEVPVAEYQEAVSKMLEKGVDDLGLLGNTAAESTDTISGSLAMAKSAWDNWLTALGRDDVDTSEYTTKLLDAISNVADNVGPRLQTIAEAMLRELPGVFSAVIEKVPGMLSGFGDAVVEGLDNAGYGDAANVLRGLGDAISGAFQWVLDNGDTIAFILGAVGGALGAFMAYQGIVTLIQGIATAFGILNAVMAANPIVLIVGLVAMLVGGFIALMATNEDFRNHVVESWNQLQALAGTVFGAICAFFTETVPAAIEGMLAFFSALPGNVMAFLQAVIANVGAWATFMVNKAMAMGQQFLASVASFFSQLPGRIGSFLSTVISRVGSWVGQMASNAGQAASQFASRLISGLSSIPGKVASIGSQIISGMVGGVTSAAGRLVGAVQDAVGGAINGAKKLLGIASPSKVFRQLGVYTMQGMTQGIMRGGAETESTMRQVANKIYDAASGAVDFGVDYGGMSSRMARMGATGGPGSGAQSVINNYEINNNVYEREDSYVAATVFSRDIMAGLGVA